MPEFTYTARDALGEKVSGSVTAVSQREVINILAGQSLFPLEVCNETPSVGHSGSRRVSGRVMATVYAQLSALLRSGVPLLRSIEVICKQTNRPRLKLVLQDVHDRLQDGTAMAEALARHPKVFSEMAVNMVRAGSEGGFLEDALERVASFTEQQEDLKSRTTGAMAYPIFLAIIGTLVITGLVVFIVPQFESEGMFDMLREQGKLPLITDVLLGFSAWLGRWWLLMLLAAATGALLLKGQLASLRGRRLRDLIKLRIPVAGDIFRNLAVARFCRVLGTMLHNGVPILKSLEISRQAAGNVILSEAIADAAENISAGQSLAVPLKSCGHFPADVTEMISVAEESNTLDTVLVEMADGIERRTARRLDLAVRLLEPMMLLVLAAAVLFVAIALLLPAINLSSIV